MSQNESKIIQKYITIVSKYGYETDNTKYNTKIYTKYTKYIKYKI